MLREDKERTVTVETSKVKEERPVAAGRCWKKIWLWAFKKTGELFICFPQKVLSRIIFLQRLGSCPSAPFLPWWSTQSSPFSSTTGTIDFHSFKCQIPYSKRKGKVKKHFKMYLYAQ